MNDSDLKAEIESLRQALDEAESTLSAIRNGEVDALVIGGHQIYTLEGADHPYRVLVEAMQHGAVTLSDDGAIIYCNTGFAQMVRKPVEELLGAPIERFFRSFTDRAFLAQRLSGQAAKQAEMVLHADDGSALPVLVSFNLVPLAHEPAVCLVITDLTEHKQNQELQDTDRRKDEFLAMLAHELRNPLAPIANAAHMLSLSNQGGNSDVQWVCDVVERQVRQLTRIVDDLLDVSRITRGKINLEKGLVDVSAIVSAAVETSRPLIEARQHRLTIALDPQPLKVHADLTRMAQVVTNLLNNAAKYTEERGEIVLAVARSGSDVTISVSDNGVGIPADMLPSIFGLFTQVDRTIDRSQGGLGIGLTLVRSLVELHQGTVNVHSDGVGTGSRFIVRLPLAVAGRGAETTLHDGNGRAAANPQTILVVDDNVDAATTLALMLKAMRHHAVIAHDGPTAIEKARTLRPTLVLLDIGLPGMDGYAVATRMRELPELQGTILAALTGYGEDHDRARSQTAGFDQHFVKPLSVTALEELIARLPKARV